MYLLSGISTWVPFGLLAGVLLPLQSSSTLALLLATSALVVAASCKYNRSPLLNISMSVNHVSLLFFLLLPLPSLQMRLGLLLLTWALAAAKMSLMTVCLHRYAAHGAFTCGGPLRFLVCFFGCLANQGGPIWWGSVHRRHHRLCDQPDDPHTPLQQPFEDAYGFFYKPGGVEIEEEYVPKHLDSPDIRLLDAWNKLPVLLEFLLAYHFAGLTGLWVASTSAWLSFTATLYFNVVYHHTPEAATDIADGKCRATDGLPLFPRVPNPFFLAGHWMLTSVKAFLGEDSHKHHHDNPGLARRPGPDFPYQTLIRPLESVGLAWNIDRRGQ